jgi:hypothetical protein
MDNQTRMFQESDTALDLNPPIGLRSLEHAIKPVDIVGNVIAQRQQYVCHIDFRHNGCQLSPSAGRLSKEAEDFSDAKTERIHGLMHCS